MRKKKFKPLLYSVLIAAFLTFVGFVFFNQYLKQNEINRKAAELKNEYHELMLQAQRLELLKEYINTDEFLIRYAREHYNLVGRNDILFYSIKK